MSADNAPKTIYLQWHPDPRAEVTWCEDEINEDDVRYVQEDKAPITQQQLSADGWQRIEYNRGALIEYWHTYKPEWSDEYRQHGCSVRVRFPDDAFGTHDFIVWVGIGGSMTPAPRVRTMGQLNQLLWLLTEDGGHQ